MISELGPEAEFSEYDSRRKWNEIYYKMRERALDNEYSFTACKRPEFKGRNRYRDVYPYDHSRIRLERNGIDYINANLVEAEKANRKYILTQGPVSCTCGHFWLMVWEQKSYAIIMLNRLIEGLRGPLHETCGHFWLMVWEQKSKAILMLNKIIEKGTPKCYPYYPMGTVNGAEDELEFPDVDLKVTYISQDDCDYYTIRKLELLDLQTNESREVLQFHYTSWPDFDVPTSPATFLDFLESVRKSGALSPNVGAPIIHCSAGIGRSGTFCLVDTCLVLIEQARSVDNIRVLDVLLDMRRYRMGLIQTADQLRFSYLAILEGATRVLPGYQCLLPGASTDSGAKLSNANGGVSDWMTGSLVLENNADGSEDDDSDDSSDLPHEHAPPPPPKHVRPMTGWAERGRTPHGEGYALETGHENEAASGSAKWAHAHQEEDDSAGEEFLMPQHGASQVTSTEMDRQASIDRRNEKIDRGIEIRRRKREERQKNTREQLERMRKRQQEAEVWRVRRLRLRPYLYGLAAVVVLGGAWLYRRYFT